MYFVIIMYINSIHHMTIINYKLEIKLKKYNEWILVKLLKQVHTIIFEISVTRNKWIKINTDMKILIVGLVAILAASLTQGASEDMGTVIGIDLGTTYSW